MGYFKSLDNLDALSRTDKLWGGSKVFGSSFYESKNWEVSNEVDSGRPRIELTIFEENGPLKLVRF